MKRGISLLMVLCMVVSLCSTIFVSAAPPAQEVTETEAAAPDAQISNALVSQIHVSGVTVPVAGQTPTVDGITCDVPGVTVTAEWLVYNYESGGFASARSFENGKIYRVDVLLTAEQPTFEWGVDITADDHVGIDWYMYDEQKIGVYIDYALGVEPVTELNITGIGDTSAGAVMTTQNLQSDKAYVEADYWKSNGEEFTFEDGVSVFEDGDAYVLDTFLSPKEGYYFTEGMHVTFEGQDTTRIWGIYTVHANVGYDIYIGEQDIEGIYLFGSVPEEIYPGAAPQLEDIWADYSNAFVTETYWSDKDGNRVTNFVNGNTYYLNVALQAEEGFRFTGYTNIYQEFNIYLDPDPYASTFTEDTYIIRFGYNSLLSRLDTLEVTVDGIELGKTVADVTVTVDNSAVDTEFMIRDAGTDEFVEGAFCAGKTYVIDIWLSSSNYRLDQGTEVFLNGESWSYETTSSSLRLTDYVSFREHIQVAEFTAPAPVIGQTPGQITASADANFVIDSACWFVEGDEFYREMQPDEVFEDGYRYWLNVSVEAANGYDFADELEVFVNGEKSEWIKVGEDNLHAWFEHGWSFAKPEIWEVSLSETLPEEIVPGAAPQVDMSVLEGQATVAEVYWTDREANRVTTLQEGKVYYLNVKLAAAEGYRFTSDTGVYTGDRNIYADEYDLVDEDTYIAKFYYSLLPKLDVVDITITGLELGKNCEDVTVTVNNLDVELEVDVVNVDDDSVTEKFQDGKAYYVWVDLENDTYDLSDADLVINGKQSYNFEVYRTGMTVWHYVSFKKHIDKVELTVPQPVVGQIPGTLTVPANANYAIGYFYWLNEDTYELVRPNEKFQDGGRYRLHYAITPYGGYDFAENVVVTINGKESGWYNPDNISGHLEGNHRWSFCKPIEKVELPAFPTNVKPGDAPKLTLTDTDQYTLGYIWVDVFADEAATKLDNGKCYVLAIYVEPKAGYETALGVTRIMVDGEEYYGWLSDLDSITVIKTYNLNQKAVDRIDLNVTAPALGATPTKITAPNSDKYEITYTQWFEGSGNLYEEKDEVVGPFTTGKYYYATISVGSLNGYAITEDTAIYVNGVKVSPKLYLAMGTGSEIVLVYQPLSDGAGDMDGDGAVNNKDVEYLLWHTLFPDSYPVSKSVDFDGDGKVNNKDVEYLLWHTLFPDSYPINK